MKFRFFKSQIGCYLIKLTKALQSLKHCFFSSCLYPIGQKNLYLWIGLGKSYRSLLSPQRCWAPHRRYDPAEMLCAVFWETSYSDMMVYILCAFSVCIFLPVLLIFLGSLMTAAGLVPRWNTYKWVGWDWESFMKFFSVLRCSGPLKWSPPSSEPCVTIVPERDKNNIKTTTTTKTRRINMLTPSWGVIFFCFVFYKLWDKAMSETCNGNRWEAPPSLWLSPLNRSGYHLLLRMDGGPTLSFASWDAH